MEEDEDKLVYEIEIGGTEESAQNIQNVRAAAEGLREQLAALKEEPLKVAPEGEKKEEKKDKGKEKAAVKRVSDMFASGMVQGIKSGDVRGAMEDFGMQLASQAATSLVSTLAQSALSMIPGIGPLLGGLFGGLFQHEGLVRSPTLAMVGEREPEFILTQERMRGLLSGGKAGYGFGPGDFGAPNVNVGSPNVNVEVSVAPGVDADIQTADRARAGEARLSQREG
jgi:hypothetical protein